MRVKKRNGNFENFNFQKISNAMKKAFDSLDVPIDPELLEEMVKEVHVYDKIDIEEIQDQIEEILIDWGFDNVAKAFKEYRYEHQLIREAKMAEKLSGSNIENQNANVDEASFGGRTGEATRIITKDYALEHCISKMAKENHLGNMIYIHDLDNYAVGMHNCLSIPFDDLLKNGFNTRQTDVRPASSINTAMQLVAVLFQLQSLQQFGGVSATHLDWTMVPYVRLSFWKHYNNICKILPFCKSKGFYNLSKDDIKEISINSKAYTGYHWYSFIKKYIHKTALRLTNKELNQACEGMYHNLNTLQSRSGNQLPFTSINYGTCTLPEGRMVIKSLLENSIKGIGKYHRTPIFPCGIFQVGKGINKKEGDPNYDLFKLALKSTSKRLYPNYANIDWSGNKGYDINDPRTYFSTMGKRKLQLI